MAALSPSCMISSGTSIPSFSPKALSPASLSSSPAPPAEAVYCVSTAASAPALAPTSTVAVSSGVSSVWATCSLISAFVLSATSASPASISTLARPSSSRLDSSKFLLESYKKFSSWMEPVCARNLFFCRSFFFACLASICPIA